MEKQIYGNHNENYVSNSIFYLNDEGILMEHTANPNKLLLLLIISVIVGIAIIIFFV